jgi:putative ABC transport system permease protein
MRPVPRLLRAFRFPWRSREDIRRDVDDELEFHLAMRAKELERGGLTPDEARRLALERFGDLEGTRRSLSGAVERSERLSRAAATLVSVGREAARAVRSLRRRPGFAICAVPVLALSVGATVVVFSLLDALLLRDLPVREPSRVIRVGERPPPDAQWTMQTVRLAVLDSWQRNAASLEGVAGYVDSQFTWNGPEGPEQIAGGAVVGDFFPMLGPVMATGTAFSEADATALPVVLSHDFWQRRFGARRDVIGKTMVIDGRTYTVAGVLPSDTGLPMLLPGRVVWLPLAPEQRDADVRVHVVARLGADTQAAVVAPELAALQSAVEDERGVARKAAGVVVESMHERRTALAGPTLAALFGGAVVLLLVACTNIGSLSLVQLLERRRELAVRASLGATRLHLLAQIAVQQGVLWSIGGALGLALGALGLHAVLAMKPFNADEIPSLDTVSVDTRVVLFACLTTLATALLFGVLPALRAANAEPYDVIRDDGASTSPSRRTSRRRSAVVVAQVALSTALAAAGLLLAMSAFNLTAQRLGFDPGNLVTWQLQLPRGDYPDQARRAQFQQALLERVRALPGVDAAATTSALPLGSVVVAPVGVEGRETSEEPTWAGFQAVDNTYFRTMRSRVTAGRDFEASDVKTSEPVVVVNETFVKRYLGTRDPIGTRVSMAPTSARVVGVVEDVKHAGLSWDYLPEVFVPYAQIAEGPSADFLGAALAVVGRVPDALAPSDKVLREVVSALDRTLPLIDRATGAELVQRSAKGARFRAGVIAGTTVLAILLSALGLYGALAGSVVQRRREFGVRMALGADAAALFGRVCVSGLALGAAGIAIGLAVVLAVGRSLQGLLFGVSAADPTALAAAALIMLVAAAAASIGPARRALRLSPMVAIRQE